MPKVNRIFFAFIFVPIIFLTGCAPKGYHNGSFIDHEAEGRSRFLNSALPEVFLWPLRGKVAVPYGAQEDWVPLKGIIIESKATDEVHAAEGGQVVLVDQNLKGYGKTIILDHPGGFSTVYAKNAEILVSVGQQVRRGELIAKAGKKNGSSSSNLYFELRKDLKAEDPMPYFKKF